MSELINRASITHAERRREEVEVESLGGSVAVVQMGLSTRLIAESVAMHQGSTQGTVYATIPHVLAGTVLDAEGLPLMTADQWAVWGGDHREDAIRLFNRAMELSGFVSAEDVQKN